MLIHQLLGQERELEQEQAGDRLPRSPTRMMTTMTMTTLVLVAEEGEAEEAGLDNVPWHLISVGGSHRAAASFVVGTAPLLHLGSPPSL